MPTATRIKNVSLRSDANQVLYAMDPPLNGDTHIVASAVDVRGSGPETYLFSANAEGGITDWCELGGSYRGGLCHAKAFRNVGYTIAGV